MMPPAANPKIACSDQDSQSVFTSLPDAGVDALRYDLPFIVRVSGTELADGAVTAVHGCRGRDYLALALCRRGLKVVHECQNAAEGYEPAGSENHQNHGLEAGDYELGQSCPDCECACSEKFSYCTEYAEPKCEAKPHADAVGNGEHDFMFGCKGFGPSEDDTVDHDRSFSFDT